MSHLSYGDTYLEIYTAYFSLKIWLCGGRLVHVPCSHIGHVARSQPYSFPGGREAIEQFNYKRAIEVWMDQEHKDLVYNYFPQMTVS